MSNRTINQKAVWGGLLFIVAGILSQATPARAQVAYTIAPPPFQTALDDSGNIIVGGCVWTYAAGTLNQIATYSNNAGSANSNPIIADYAGRFTVYLIAGTNYKFVYESACTPPAHGATLRTADNIAGVPASAATTDTSGTAGETISAGQCAYLSDGSGGKTGGSWYKCDTANAYSNTLPMVGLAPAAITIGTTGTIRLAGPVTGLSALTIGADYFVGASGAISATLPNGNRYLGRADTTSSLVVGTNPRLPPQAWADDFRLTLTTATCVTTADVTAATTLYLTPCYGNRIDLPDSLGNPQRHTTAEISIAVPATTSQMYDVFVYSSAGTATLELLAWTNDTTRATALVRTNGRWLKTGDLTREYLGSFRTTTVSGQTEDSNAKRYVWNYYNRAKRRLRIAEATASWNYTTAAYHQANAAPANQVDAVIGVQEGVPVSLQVSALVLNTTGSVSVAVAIGLDSTTAADTSNLIAGAMTVSTTATPLHARYEAYPSAGRHFFVWLEISAAVGTTTWQSNGALIAGVVAGVEGWVEG